MNESNGAAAKSVDRTGIFPVRCGGAHVNVIYVQVQSGSKINAVGSDSGLISSGLSRVGFIFFFYIYARRVRVRSDSGRVWILGPKKTSTSSFL